MAKPKRSLLSEEGKTPEQAQHERELALARPVWELCPQSLKERLLALDSKFPCKMGDLFQYLSQEKELSN